MDKLNTYTGSFFLALVTLQNKVERCSFSLLLAKSGRNDDFVHVWLLNACGHRTYSNSNHECSAQAVQSSLYRI